MNGFLHEVSSHAGTHAPAGRRFAATVAARKVLGGLVWLTAAVPGWPGARPGQFALLQAEPSGCFLGRPLSVADEDGDRVSFLIAPVGPGTRELCGLTPGDVLWVLGPLGNGFQLEAMLPAVASRLLLVGGGVGVAPFPLLLRRLAAPEHPAALLPAEVVALLGFRDDLQAAGAEPVVEAATALLGRGVTYRVVVMTEDGSGGERGMGTDALARELRAGDAVAVCGPPAMTQAVWPLCAAVAGARTWFSLEAGMACGVGSCHGCVIPLADGSLARVCAEGPVFMGEQVWGKA